MEHLYFFSVPVYRVNEAEYEREWIASSYNQMLQRNAQYYLEDREARAQAKDALQREFGGLWEFNEIIGYIKLYILGSQIRGKYFFNSSKKQYRSRKKLFEEDFNHKFVPEMELPLDKDNLQIFETILLYLADCEKKLNKNLRRKKRYFDLSILNKLGPFINWKEFIATHMTHVDIN